MADTKLFNIKGAVKEYQSGTVTLEKELQTVIENNMNIFFGVTFLASEYRTTDGGRMDSIGIDENHCPVIFEYKRSVKENVINQGLFYLNWILDHKDSFKVLVIEKLGLKAANNIDWSMPRVVCVAGDFTKYDESAIKQMNRNISLIRYKKFGEDLLMFEQVNENVVSAIPDNEASVYKGYKRDKIEMRGDRAEISDFPLYLNTVAGGLDRRDQTIGGFSFVVKIYALPVVEIIGQLLYLLGRYGFNAQFGDCL